MCISFYFSITFISIFLIRFHADPLWLIIEERHKNALSLPYYDALHRLHCRNQRLRRNAGRSTTMAGHFKTLAFPREAQVINQNRVSE